MLSSYVNFVILIFSVREHGAGLCVTGSVFVKIFLFGVLGAHVYYDEAIAACSRQSVFLTSPACFHVTPLACKYIFILVQSRCIILFYICLFTFIYFSLIYTFACIYVLLHFISFHWPTNNIQS